SVSGSAIRDWSCREWPAPTIANCRPGAKPGVLATVAVPSHDAGYGEIEYMKPVFADLVSLVLIALTVALTLAWYPQLPDPMPIHWNAAGEVDGYMPKAWGVAMLPATAAFMFLVMKLVLLLSPKQHKTDELLRMTALFQVLLTGFMCTIAVLVLLESMGHDTMLDRVIFGGIGLILVVVGATIGKVRKNFFLGIRTPWTMWSDEVWDRTHRLGGKLFMLAGLLLFINAFVRLDLRLTLPVVVVLMLIPVVYSWIIYRGLRDRAGKDPAG
ncbi:MAG: SdpI family protein, partial [Woeseiaceae bacterium]|nr:SdpI family protein [Woeseiaceae bacterium]